MAEVSGRRKPAERAVVTYTASHGAEAPTISDSGAVSFGESADCDARFACPSVPDEGVPRVAGRLVAAPTNRFDLGLTELQQSILVAYCEPHPRGRLQPVTHKDVDEARSYHPNTAREILYDVWALMFAHDVPMPDVSDKSVASAEAARVHGRLWAMT